MPSYFKSALVPKVKRSVFGNASPFLQLSFIATRGSERGPGRSYLLTQNRNLTRLALPTLADSPLSPQR